MTNEQADGGDDCALAHGPALARGAPAAAFPTTVPEAAKLLDAVRPGWAAEINLAELRMVECSRCVLGQLYGDAEAGWAKLFPNAGERYPDGQWFFERDKPFGYSEPGVLEAEWTREVEARR